MSEMHCNFMINTGQATAYDLEALGETVRARVLLILPISYSGRYSVLVNLNKAVSSLLLTHLIDLFSVIKIESFQRDNKKIY